MINAFAMDDWVDERVAVMPQRGIRCLSKTPINKGALIAICDIEIAGWHLLLKECKWFRKNNKQWIGLPSTSFTDREGKKIYKTVVEFSDKDAAARFQAAALEAVEMFMDN